MTAMNEEQRADGRSDRAGRAHSDDDGRGISLEFVERLSVPPATAQAPNSRYGAVMNVLGEVAKWFFRRAGEPDNLIGQLRHASEVACSFRRHNKLYWSQVLFGSLNDGVAQGSESDQVATGVSKAKQMLAELARPYLAPLEEKLSNARDQLKIEPSGRLEDPHASMEWVRKLSARERGALSQALDSYCVAATDLTGAFGQLNGIFSALDKFSEVAASLKNDELVNERLTIQQEWIAPPTSEEGGILSEQRSQHMIAARLTGIRKKLSALNESCVAAADLTALTGPDALGSQKESVPDRLSAFEVYVETTALLLKRIFLVGKDFQRWFGILEESTTSLAYECCGVDTVVRPADGPLAGGVSVYRKHQKAFFDATLDTINDGFSLLLAEVEKRVRESKQDDGGDASQSADKTLRFVAEFVNKMRKDMKPIFHFLEYSHSALDKLTASVLHLEAFVTPDSAASQKLGPDAYPEVYHAYCRWLVGRWEDAMMNSREPQMGGNRQSLEPGSILKTALSDCSADLVPLWEHAQDTDLERAVAVQLRDFLSRLGNEPIQSNELGKTIAFP